MSLKVPQAQGGASLFKDGYKFQQGLEDAVLRNIDALLPLSSLLRTSYGPQGRNKIVINHLDREFVTNDAGTILKELEVVHPMGKIVVGMGERMAEEIGDRTSLVPILAGSLLTSAANLLKVGLHPGDVIRGFEMAQEKAGEEIEKLACASLSLASSSASTTLPPLSLHSSILPIFMSKQYDNDPSFLSSLVEEAVTEVLPVKDPSRFVTDNVRIVRVLGGGLRNSKVVRGMVFPKAPEGTVRKVLKGRVGVFTCGIDVAQTETKGTVLLKSGEELMDFSKGEEKHLEKVILELVSSGMKVVVAGSTLSDLALHYLNKHGLLVLRIPSKFDLRRLCRVVGATPLARLGAPMAEEMGYCDIVEVDEIGGDWVTVFRQGGDEGLGLKSGMSTIVLRGATANQMDSVTRTINSSLSLIKCLLSRDSRLLPGAGASEIEISKRVGEYGEKVPGLAQHAIRKWAEGLEVVPRTLAENANLGGGSGLEEVMGRLWERHLEGGEEGRFWGVDVEGGNDGTIDVRKTGVYDLLAGTLWATKYATDAATTILKVDAIIMSKAAGIAAPKQNPNWDED